LHTAVNADRSYAPAYDALALVYMELKEDAQAEANFRQSLKMNPNSSETRNNYGLFLCQRGREKEGLRQLLDALKNPLYQTPDVAYKNAGVCARKSDPKLAEGYFHRAVKLNPNQAQAWYGLAEVSFARDDYAAAKEYLGRYVALVGNPGPDGLWLGARIEHRLGDRTALANYGMQLRRRFPSSPETKAYLDGRFE
jgi:type IV pilus assembly protein PilF